MLNATVCDNGDPRPPRELFAHSYTAYNCGTPTPAIIRVVQIEPGPYTYFHCVCARLGKAPVPRSAVAMLPAITWQIRVFSFYFL